MATKISEQEFFDEFIEQRLPELNIIPEPEGFLDFVVKEMLQIKKIIEEES